MMMFYIDVSRLLPLHQYENPATTVVGFHTDEEAVASKRLCKTSSLALRTYLLYLF